MLDFTNDKQALYDLLDSLTEPNADIDNAFITGLCTHYFPKLEEGFIGNVGEDSPVLAAIMYKKMSESCDDEALAAELIHAWLRRPIWQENATTKECFHEFVRGMNRKGLLSSEALVTAIDISLLEFTTDTSNIACLQEAGRTLKELYLTHQEYIDVECLGEVFLKVRSFLTLNHFSTMLLNSPCVKMINESEKLRDLCVDRIRELDRAEESIAGVAAVLLYDLDHNDLFEELATFKCSQTVNMILQKIFAMQLKDEYDIASKTYELLEASAAPEVNYFLPHITYMKRGGELVMMVKKYTQELRDPKLCSTEVLRKFLLSLSNQVPHKFYVHLIVSLGPRIILRPNDFFYLELMKKDEVRQGMQTVINLHLDTADTERFHSVLDIINYFEETVKKPLGLTFSLGDGKRNDAKHQRFHDNLKKAMKNEYVFLAQDALRVFSRYFVSQFIHSATEFYNLREDKEFKLIVIRRLREIVQTKIPLARKMAILIVNKVTDDAPDYDLFVAAQRLADELDRQFVTKERREKLATHIRDMEAAKKRAVTRSEGKERVDDILRTLSGPNQGHTNCVAKECY